MRKPLGPLQRSILLYLYDYHRKVEQAGSPAQRAALWQKGILWRPSAAQSNWTRSDAASFSRALRGLEDRRLIERRYPEGSNTRKTRVVLTFRGLDYAREIRDEK